MIVLWLVKILPDFFLKCLYHFTPPPTMCVSYGCPLILGFVAFSFYPFSQIHNKISFFSRLIFFREIHLWYIGAKQYCFQISETSTDQPVFLMQFSLLKCGQERRPPGQTALGLLVLKCPAGSFRTNSATYFQHRVLCQLPKSFFFN